MNTLENALLVCDEELGELAEACLKMQARIKKVQRFTGEEMQPGDTLTNAQRVKEEFTDLIGAACNLQAKGFSLDLVPSDIIRKISKIRKYEEYSREVGAISDNT